MKRFLFLIIGLALSIHLANAQTPQPHPLPAPTPPGAPVPVQYEDARFDLDFPGGTPQQLVDLLQKQSGEPLNVVIPDQFTKIQLPQLHMKQVTVTALFEALKLASKKNIRYVTGTYYSGMGQPTQQYQIKITSYGFMPAGSPSSPVWYFYYDGGDEFPMDLPKLCRFWQLTTYLDTCKVEDITTSIKTGWELLGVKNPPTLKYHPETKLLIGVGQAEDLKIIDAVLEQLKQAHSAPVPEAKLIPPPVPVPNSKLPAKE